MISVSLNVNFTKIEPLLKQPIRDDENQSGELLRNDEDGRAQFVVGSLPPTELHLTGASYVSSELFNPNANGVGVTWNQD